MSGNHRREDSGRSIQVITSSVVLSWAPSCRSGVSVLYSNSDSVPRAQSCALIAHQFFTSIVISRRIASVSILKESFVALLLLLVGSIAVAQETQPVVMPRVD